MAASLARIDIYPLKSGNSQSVASAKVLASGALELDRRFALVDEDGLFIHGKRTPLFHALRTHYDPLADTLKLEHGGRRQGFRLADDGRELEAWLSDYFGLAVRLIENPTAGLPDDTESPGPTVISTATLATVASWFDGLSLEEVRSRFRANLEIDGVEPFWEDRLYRKSGEVVEFRVGSVTFGGVNPCQRCIVPTRESHSGQVWHGFAKQFSQHRAQSLPDWAERSRFDHYYRLCVNTRLVGQPDQINVGDVIDVC